MRNNILRAVESQDSGAFLAILDDAFKQAAKAASAESHALGLDVADGRRCDPRAEYQNNGLRGG